LRGVLETALSPHIMGIGMLGIRAAPSGLACFRRAELDSKLVDIAN